MSTPTRYLAAAFAAIIIVLLAGPATAAPGDLDTTFDPGTGPNDSVRSAIPRAGEKVFIGGFFTSVGGTTRNRIARLDSDGTLDLSFAPGAGAGASVYATALQPDGSVLIAGDFTTVNSTTRNRIARLHSGGTLDTSFDPGAGADGTVYSTVLQPDGKIIIGGFFTTVGGTARNRIARLNADGTLDTTFDPGVGADDTVYATALQPDGKVIIGGFFTSVGGTTRNRIARLNADGTLDSTFDPEVSHVVRSAAVQADGKVLIAGDFTTVNSTARIRIARLNANGTLDTTFDPGAGASGSVYSMALQADGKVFISGEFSMVGGTARSNIARLNADGTLDTVFDPGTGADDSVFSTALQADGKVFIGGRFLTVDGTARNQVARLDNGAATGSLIVPSLTQVQWTRGGTTPEATRVTFDYSINDGKNYLPLGNGVRITGGWALSGANIPAQCIVRAHAFTMGGQYNGSSGIIEESVMVNLTSNPSVRIRGKKKITTSRGRLRIRGTASDPDGDLTSVLFRDTRTRGRRWRAARGTASWRAVAVLKPGGNAIRVQAFDSRNAGSLIQRVRVVRK